MIFSKYRNITIRSPGTVIVSEFHKSFLFIENFNYEGVLKYSGKMFSKEMNVGGEHIVQIKPCIHIKIMC